MKQNLYTIFQITLLLIPLQSYAIENETSFVTGIGLGRNTLEFVSPGTTDGAQNGEFFVLDVSETVLYGPFFVSAAVIISLDDDNFYNAVPPSYTNGITYVDRNDYSLTAGYSVTEWLSVYLGNSVGKTIFTSTTTNGFGFVANHDDSGLFAGLTVSYPVMSGTLGFDVAYASFDGEVHTQTPDPAQPILGDRILFGDTTGFSFGINWIDTSNDGRTYFVKLKVRKYEFEANGSSNNPQPVGVKIDKDFLMISAGLYF